MLIIILITYRLCSRSTSTLLDEPTLDDWAFPVDTARVWNALLASDHCFNSLVVYYVHVRNKIAAVQGIFWWWLDCTTCNRCAILLYIQCHCSSSYDSVTSACSCIIITCLSRRWSKITSRTLTLLDSVQNIGKYTDTVYEKFILFVVYDVCNETNQ